MAGRAHPSARGEGFDRTEVAVSRVKIARNFTPRFPLYQLKTMKNCKYGLLALIACQALFLSGCTSALWEKERFARCHWPANPPNLRLFYSESARDVLAEYDETSQGTTTVQHRAYWLEPNAMAVAAGRQPRFVAITNAQGLVVVPVTDNLASPPPSAYRGLYAVVSTNGQSFSLYLGEKESTVYGLPVYYAGSGQRAKQVLLTPFAVATDLTLVGGVVFVIAASHAEADRCLERTHRH